MHTTPHILMIRPVNFSYNAQTAVNNAFQIKSENEFVQQSAVREFDGMVELLRENGVDVITINDTPEPHTPDSIFPNNWVSFHEDGTVVLYPMYAPNRRQERKPSVINMISKKFRIRSVIDLSRYEEQDKFLEGTGSVVLDRDQKIAYACISPRTDSELFKQFCSELHYHAVTFDAVDQNGRPIYHTNVMMCVADRYIVICLDCIPDEIQRAQVVNTIKNSGKELIEISRDQLNHFAGNMLQINNLKGEKLLVMSSQAYNSLTASQIAQLESYNRIIHAPLTTIETNGGGSARCMMAEVHLPSAQETVL